MHLQPRDLTPETPAAKPNSLSFRHSFNASILSPYLSQPSPVPAHLSAFLVTSKRSRRAESMLPPRLMNFLVGADFCAWVCRVSIVGGVFLVRQAEMCSKMLTNPCQRDLSALSFCSKLVVICFSRRSCMVTQIKPSSMPYDKVR